MSTQQLALDLAPLVRRPIDSRLSLAEQWAQFHADNPHVADALEQLAESWFAAGNPRIGTKALWERLRWEAGVQTNAQDYRLNNNWPAFYSRVLLERRPEWSGRILTRVQRAT